MIHNFKLIGKISISDLSLYFKTYLHCNLSSFSIFNLQLLKIMALVPDQKLRKSFLAERKPLMLKDYLRDDLSSCSSNGFKSFPRRKCCTTVRFLLEIDLKTKHSHKYNSKPSLLQRSRSKVASTTISALQRASEALRNAVKQLPFPSIKSPSPSAQRRPKRGLLPRSFSRKLWKRSFWRKTADIEAHTIERWKLFREFLEEKHQPSDQNTHQHSTSTLTPNRISTSCSSKSNSNSWAESDFAVDILRSSSGNSEISSENDTVESKKDVLSVEKTLVSDRVGVSCGEDSITYSDQDNTKDWPNEEEKEQFSPVSVLDCPFEDDKDDSSSPFQHRLARMEGKIRRFESLAQLEPVDLEKRIALSEHEDETLESPFQSCSISILNNNKLFNEDGEDETEKKVRELLKLMRSTTQSNSLMCKADILLSDFFREKLEEINSKVDCKEFEQDLLKIAQDWINGESLELLVGWEVEAGRKAYIKDMEQNGRFRNVNEEKEEVGLALELEIFTTLVNEFVLDLL